MAAQTAACTKNEGNGWVPSRAGTKRCEADAADTVMHTQTAACTENQGDKGAPSLADTKCREADSASTAMETQTAACTKNKDNRRDPSATMNANAHQHLFVTSDPNVTQAEVLRALSLGNTEYLLRVVADPPTPSTRAHLRTIDLGVGREDREYQGSSKTQH